MTAKTYKIVQTKKNPVLLNYTLRYLVTSIIRPIFALTAKRFIDSTYWALGAKMAMGAFVDVMSLKPSHILNVDLTPVLITSTKIMLQVVALVTASNPYTAILMSGIVELALLGGILAEYTLHYLTTGNNLFLGLVYFTVMSAGKLTIMISTSLGYTNLSNWLPYIFTDVTNLIYARGVLITTLFVFCVLDRLERANFSDPVYVNKYAKGNVLALRFILSIALLFLTFTTGSYINLSRLVTSLPTRILTYYTALPYYIRLTIYGAFAVCSVIPLCLLDLWGISPTLALHNKLTKGSTRTFLQYTNITTNWVVPFTLSNITSRKFYTTNSINILANLLIIVYTSVIDYFYVVD